MVPTRHKVPERWLFIKCRLAMRRRRPGNTDVWQLILAWTRNHALALVLCMVENPDLLQTR